MNKAKINNTKIKKRGLKTKKQANKPRTEVEGKIRKKNCPKKYETEQKKETKRKENRERRE